MKKYLYFLLLSGIISRTNPMHAQIDCTTPNGIFAMMAAGAIESASAQDVDNTGTVTLTCSANSRLFAAAQSAVNTPCANRIHMHLYYSTTNGALNNLPNLSTQPNWVKPNNVSEKSASFTLTSGSTNIYHTTANVPRGSMVQGTMVYYRWGKEIEQDNATDPWVWSSVLTFVVTAPTPPPPPPAVNLKPLNNLDVPLYNTQGGSFGDGNTTYMGVVTSFCDDIQTLGTQTGTLQGNYADKRIFSRTIQLPPITWGVQNTATTTNVTNNFTCQLFKNNGTTPVQTFNVNNMGGNDQMVTTFTNRGSVTVFYFPGPNPGLCFAQVTSSSGSSISGTESNYKVVVDSGNAVTESNETTSDNSKTYTH